MKYIIDSYFEELLKELDNITMSLSRELEGKLDYSLFVIMDELNNEIRRKLDE